MTVKSLIEKAGFCSIKERNFELDEDIKLPYFCCKRKANINCQKSCEGCDNVFARYVIIDLTDNDIRQICGQYIFSSKENFEVFQENYLSEIFFYENSNIRYNIYLIFLCKKDNVACYMDYAYDINYARKYFFTLDEFEEYFLYYDLIFQQAKNSSDRQIIEELEKIVRRLDSKGMKSVLLEDISNTQKTKEALLKYIMSPKLSYDNICSVTENYKVFFNKYVYQSETIKKKKINYVNNVRKIILNNFRENCFGENKELEFGRANIICGINTGGKTSLLDAIEYGLTGSMHKYGDDDFSRDTKVIIEGMNGCRISSDESKKNSVEIKNIWYPNKIGKLDELFSRVNYFDTDGAYRFALEQGTEEETYKHIKALLSTSKLIDLEERLKDALQEINMIRFLVDNNQSIVKLIVKKKKLLQNNKRNFFARLFQLFNKDASAYEIDKKKLKMMGDKIDDFEKECNDGLKQIDELINKQTLENLKVLNIIFHRLHSANCEVLWQEEAFMMKSPEHEELVTIDRMSTAQKVCLALSVIFTQFVLANDAPKIILLDESVVNFDALHLLNLFDFLREFTLHGVQIFFTTANEDVAKVAKSKLDFLGEQCFIYKIEKNPGETSQIIKIN